MDNDLTTEELERLDVLAEKATPGKRESVYTTYQCYVAVDGSKLFVVSDWHLAPGFVPPKHVDAEYETACDPDMIRTLVRMARRGMEHDADKKKRAKVFNQFLNSNPD